MSNELVLLSQWLPFGFFHDTEDLATELNISSIAEMMFRLEYQPVDGLDLQILLIVCGVKYYKSTKLIPDAQNMYDALIVYHIENKYDESDKINWVNTFIEDYKTKNNINKEQN